METLTKNASDMFKIVTQLGGFDVRELMLEIHRLQGRRDAKVNLRTVERAVANVSARYPR